MEQKDKVSYAIIGCAMAVHRELGPGLDESLYHQLLYDRLRADGSDVVKKPRERLTHRDLPVDVFECDLLLPARCICELKVLHGGFAREHYAQILCYLKFWRIRVGLLFDFGKESLIYKRIVYDELPAPEFSPEAFIASTPADSEDRARAAIIAHSLARLLRAFGLGYRDTTYAALLCAELRAEAIVFDFQPVVKVATSNNFLGDARLNCIALGNGVVISVLAWRDEISAADRAIHQTYLKHLKARWGVIVNFGKRQLTWRVILACQSFSKSVF